MVGTPIFIQLLFSVIAKIWANKPPEMIWAVIGLFISHGVSFIENYILGNEYETSTMKRLMQQPYQRIIVMHLAILGGGIFVMKLDSPVPLLIIFIMLKIFFDLHFHKKSHRPPKQVKDEKAQS